MRQAERGTEDKALRIVVDDREQGSRLAEAVAALWPSTYVGRLPAGDVEIGSRVLVERKTVADLVASLEDGRLFRQAKALSQASSHPLLIVEGEDGFEATRLAPTALRGVLLTLLVGFRLPLLRTGTTAETAISLVRIAKQETRRLAKNRRSKASPTRARAALDILGTIPGVGDEKARRLLAGFGTLRQIVVADREDLTRTAGVGPETARAIQKAFGDEEPAG